MILWTVEKKIQFFNYTNNNVYLVPGTGTKVNKRENKKVKRES